MIRMAAKANKEPSLYMQELTRYLSNIMNSVLLALPTEIKGFIYFDALSHAATAILVRSIYKPARVVSLLHLGAHPRRPSQENHTCRCRVTSHRHRLPGVLRWEFKQPYLAREPG
jgi:hypothetical protein